MKKKIREKIFKQVFIASDYLKQLASWLSGLSLFVFSVSAILFILLFFFHIGFFQPEIHAFDLEKNYKLVFFVLFLSKFTHVFLNIKNRKLYVLIIDLLIFLFGMGVLVIPSSSLFENQTIQQFLGGKSSLILISFVLIFSEADKIFFGISSLKIPPTLLFVLSFLIIILIGSGLLMLPKAHTLPITYLDALFTSTSAVCVTGLIVLDTSTAFTTTGQIIILVLIQIGGLGIMTFTGFLAYIFTGTASLSDRMMLKDILSSENLGSLFRVLIKILLITFLTEFIGAVFIYFNTPGEVADKMLFSVFHSISAFCNAGFSTLPQGLSTDIVHYNYNIHFIAAFLIILGGIGFPVLLVLIKSFTRFFVAISHKVQHKKKLYFGSRDMNTSIVLTTTIALLVTGTAIYYLLEKDSSLSGLTPYQQVVTAFFGSVSARTAGFNIVDISLWTYPTVFIMIFLMWVGASPGSTGGGIKTTTFAVAIRAAVNFVRGRNNLEIRHREIGSGTILRVTVVIILSIVIIFSGFLGLLIFEPSKNPVHLLFESFSAFGTVGLSLVNTATLNENSKWIIIFLMFIGRIGPVTLLTRI
jgi:potassium uptake TrkH family protein